MGKYRRPNHLLSYFSNPWNEKTIFVGKKYIEDHNKESDTVGMLEQYGFHFHAASEPSINQNCLLSDANFTSEYGS